MADKLVSLSAVELDHHLVDMLAGQLVEKMVCMKVEWTASLTADWKVAQMDG